MSSLHPLCIVPAGAGSGKTYSIQTRVGEWVAEGLVAPERVVAVTFTEVGASELRERLVGHLLSAGRIDDALGLSQAYITTIHGLGLRLLTEFAFQAGTSPQPRLLSDDERNALVRKALARTDKADAILADLARYGYAFSAGTSQSGEDIFRDDLLEVVGLLRSIGLSSASALRRQYASAAREIERRYGAGRPAPGEPAELWDIVNVLLRTFPDCLTDDYSFGQTATEQYKNDFRSLQAAARPGALDSDWKLWQKLRSLRVGDSRLLPHAYLRLASHVKEEAGRLVGHPGPLRQACDHLLALLAAGLDVLEHYDRSKREAGLVDYTDMVAGAEHLLRTRPGVLQILASRIDCLVVDEFQDTNPLQFALLWHIKEAGVPTLVAGDVKQAIMGFQGADPRLFEALERNHPDVSRPLTRNWRSQADLVRLANALGPALFGDGYVALEPQRQPSAMDPLEVVRFDTNPKRDRHRTRAYSVGRRLKALLEDPAQTVLDRQTNLPRRLRGSDLAVLCPTNSALSDYAEVLTGLGLRVNIQADGWLSSRPVQIAWHALAYLANGADRHAALYLAVTELGSLSLERGLQQLIDDGRVDDPLLRRLDELAADFADRTIYALVADVLAALRLFDHVALWPDADQARANLIRLLGEAGEFMETNREALAEGGYHGSGIQTFQAWLAAREKESDQLPEKSVLDEDAIAMRTWHRCKGLEWPVVAVCNMDRQVKSRLPRLDLEYSSFDDLSSILENACIDYWPSYAAPEHNRSQLKDLQERAETEAKRLLYVALTRARDKLILEWPSFKFRGPTRRTVCYATLPGGVWELDAGGGEPSLLVDGRPFACALVDGRSALPEGFEADAGREEPALPVVGRRAIRRGTLPTGLTPDSRAASSLEPPEEPMVPAGLRVSRYGGGLEVDVGLRGTDLGTYLHRCFELLGTKPELAWKLTELTGIEADAGTAVRIASAVERFEAWVRQSFRARGALREWPLMAVDSDGTVMLGTADLIVETKDGVWVLDHKSDRVEDASLTFARYRPQLEAYASALASEGRTVLGVGINLIRTGQVVWWPSSGAPGEGSGARGPARSAP